jgi:hypothetical protein
MATTYPFELIRAKPHELELFKKILPHIAKEMPEFFRSMEVANTSIEQKKFSDTQRLNKSIVKVCIQQATLRDFD